MSTVHPEESLRFSDLHMGQSTFAGFKVQEGQAASSKAWIAVYADVLPAWIARGLSLLARRNCLPMDLHMEVTKHKSVDSHPAPTSACSSCLTYSSLQ